MSPREENVLQPYVDRVFEEEKTGSVQKETLLQIADFFATHTLREINQDYRAALQAHEILIKYRLYKLVATYKQAIQNNIDKERKKPYQARCSRCGLAITSKKSLKAGLGVVCRKRLGVKLEGRSSMSGVG